MIQREVLQELMEEGGSISSPKEYYSSHNQSTGGQFDLADVTDDGNMSKVTSLTFLHTPVPSTLNGIITEPLDNTKDVEQLEKHCRDLKSQLDLVKIEILKIISEKKACSKENCALKIHISDLKNRLHMDEVLKDVSCLHVSRADPRLEKCQEVPSGIRDISDAPECTTSDNSGDAVNESVLGKQVTLECNILKGSEVGVATVDNDVSTLVESNRKCTEQVTYKETEHNEKEKFDLPEKSSEHSNGVKYSASSSVLQRDGSSKALKTEEEKRVQEIAALRERCCELENSLELLRQVGFLVCF